MKEPLVDHLFRHQYGKMVAVLTNVFGLSHIETVEDAIQDTFIQATISWRQGIPENPEGWLMKAAKNRTIDLFRKISSEKKRFEKLSSGSVSHQLNELFLDHEVEDAQLRMIFVACHPDLSAEEQLAFALKTISGFSMTEIASALLTKEETIKKRLSRARKKIVNKGLRFEYPSPSHVQNRLESVQQVIYLIFNEGFHSNKKDQLIDKDLCGEAMRLCQLILKKRPFRSGSMYALFALLCFHSARLESKMDSSTEAIIDLEHQDRTSWYPPLIQLGKDSLLKSQMYPDTSSYLFEAMIAQEHLTAVSFKDTNWSTILQLYKEMYRLYPHPFHLLTMAIIHLQMSALFRAKELLDQITSEDLGQRGYLLFGTYSDYYVKMGMTSKAIEYIDRAITVTQNEQEKVFLRKKRTSMG